MLSNFHEILITALACGLCGGFVAAAQEVTAVTAVSAVSAADSVAGGPVVLRLEDCLEMAASQSYDVAAAELDLRAAEYQKAEAFAEYFPTVSAMGLGFHSLRPMIDLGVTDIFGKNDFAYNLQNVLGELAAEAGVAPRLQTLSHGYMVGVSALQPLYAGGRIVNGNRLAKLGVQAAGLNVERARRKTVQQVEQIWWQLVSLEDKKTTLLRVSDILGELSASSDAAVAAGLVPETDVLELQLRRSETASGLRQIESGTRLAKMALLNAIGFEYSLLAATASDERPFIDDVELSFGEFEALSPEAYRIDEEELLGELVEKKLLDVQVSAAELQKKMALGEALPQVAVGVSGSYSQFIGDGRANALALATVSVPISDWGKTARKLQRLGTQVQKVELQRERLGDQMRLALGGLWVNVESCYDALLGAEESLGIATRLLEAARANYGAGRIGVADLLGAEAAYRQAATARTDALIAYRNAVTAYRNPTVGE